MIAAALDLFHAHGVRGTSPQDVMARTDTGKSQFYHYFGSKEGLVSEALQFVYAELCEGGFNNQPITSWKDLERWFGFYVAAQKRYRCERSCPIGTIGQELDSNQDLLRRDVNAIFNKSLANLARFFDAQKAHKKMKAKVDAPELARFCVSAVQGGLLLSKIQRRIDPLESAVKHALAHVRSLR